MLSLLETINRSKSDCGVSSPDAYEPKTNEKSESKLSFNVSRKPFNLLCLLMKFLNLDFSARTKISRLFLLSIRLGVLLLPILSTDYLRYAHYT